MVTITADVDVDLDEFDIDHLIDEVESHGYVVLDEDDPMLEYVPFDADDINAIMKLIDEKNPAPGTELYFIREKCVWS